MEEKITIFDCDTCSRMRGSKECEMCATDSNDSRSIPSYWISKKETVNHPSHYQSKSGLEAIDVIEAFCDGLEGIEAFCTGNALKYLCRWKSKNGIEDLRKAEWYLQRLIRHMELVEADKKLGLTTTNKDVLLNGKSYKEIFKEMEKESK